MDSGWHLKHMVKLMVMSSTYRQSSNPRPELKEIDPANRLVASQSPRRLEAELVRDNALAIARLLNPDIGGPPAPPELKEIDPANRLVASQSPRRLEAELVRDNALAIAGLLNPDIGGPSAHPYQPAGYYANLQFPNRDYIADADERQY